jgi:hypothetical protein
MPEMPEMPEMSETLFTFINSSISFFINKSYFSCFWNGVFDHPFPCLGLADSQ